MYHRSASTVNLISQEDFGGGFTADAVRMPCQSLEKDRIRPRPPDWHSTLAVACPFCTAMLDDRARGDGVDLRMAGVAALPVEPGAADAGDVG